METKHQRILVTGSKGVIGTGLVAELKSRGHYVFEIDISHQEGEIGWEQVMSKVTPTYCRCDVSDYRQLERVFERYGKFDFVYHAAAEFGRWNGEDFYEQVWKSNAIGTKNIIRLQEKLRFKLIMFSSSEVYGDFEGVMDEQVMDTTEIKQLNDYALSKWVNEQQVRNSVTKYGTETVIIRFFNTYGPGEWYHPYRSVVCKFCYHALKGEPITVFKGHKRSSCFLSDACTTVANIADNFLPGSVYNIGNSYLHSIEELAQVIWKVAGADPSLITYVEEPEVLTTLAKRANFDQAKKDLKHNASTSLEDGVRKTIEWMRQYYKTRL